MILLTHPQNVDGTSLDSVKPTSSYTCYIPDTQSYLTLFRSDKSPSGHSTSFGPDPPLFDYKKTDKEPVGEFLQRDIYYHMGIKDFLSEQASFYEYTWEIIIYIVMTDKGHSSLDIWLETPNQDTNTENMIRIIWYKEVMK